MIARVACLFLIDEQHRRDYAIIRFRNRSGSITRLDSTNLQIKISWTRKLVRCFVPKLIFAWWQEC